ncbi:MAG: DNA alkylation response protein, partial [Burkholderiaceae bacterium]
TSNIVALDVLRAIERDDALSALRTHVDHLLAEAGPAKVPWTQLEQDSIDKAFALAKAAASQGSADLARQVGTALYNVTTLAALRWEARKANLPAREAIATQVLMHRLAPRDPLIAADLGDASLSL